MRPGRDGVFALGRRDRVLGRNVFLVGTFSVRSAFFSDFERTLVIKPNFFMRISVAVKPVGGKRKNRTLPTRSEKNRGSEPATGFLPDGAFAAVLRFFLSITVCRTDTGVLSLPSFRFERDTLGVSGGYGETDVSAACRFGLLVRWIGERLSMSGMCLSGRDFLFGSRVRGATEGDRSETLCEGRAG